MTNDEYSELEKLSRESWDRLVKRYPEQAKKAVSEGVKRMAQDIDEMILERWKNNKSLMDWSSNNKDEVIIEDEGVTLVHHFYHDGESKPEEYLVLTLPSGCQVRVGFGSLSNYVGWSDIEFEVLVDGQ